MFFQERGVYFSVGMKPALWHVRYLMRVPADTLSTLPDPSLWRSILMDLYGSLLRLQVELGQEETRGRNVSGAKLGCTFLSSLPGRFQGLCRLAESLYPKSEPHPRVSAWNSSVTSPSG